MAGVVAVEITGGPDVPFHPGREVSDDFLSSNVSDLSDCVRRLDLFFVRNKILKVNDVLTINNSHNALLNMLSPCFLLQD